MKNFFILLNLILSSLNSSSQPVVYFNFLSHNEESSIWDGTPFYTSNRAKVVTLSNYFYSKGITWNLQSDWRYLNNAINQDTAFFPLTNNKNILRWMFEDKGVEMDPHAHESVYIYPDVVKLMDSLGLPESKVMGGSIYNDSNGINVWTNLINGQNGIIFPGRFWQPDYMMGGGTPNHTADLNYYGFWNPQDTANYLTHSPSSHLRHLGVGCEIKIKDTSTVSAVIQQLNDVVQKVQNGLYPSDGFYLQTIFFEQGDLNNMSFYNKLIEIADSANAIVAGGNAQWKTLKQAYTLWETMGSNIFQWECGQELVSEVEKTESKNTNLVFPNPCSGKLSVRVKSMGICKVELYNVLGEKIFSTPETGNSLAFINSDNSITIDIRKYASGLYFICLVNNEERIIQKVIIE